MAKQTNILPKVTAEAFSRMQPDAPHPYADQVLAQLRARVDHIDTFSIGRYFWFIADTVSFTHVEAGGALEEMLPLQLHEFVNAPAQVLFQHIHPEDGEKMFAFSKYYAMHCSNLLEDERKHIRTSIFIRLKNKQGEFYWALIQYLDAVFNEAGQLVYMLTLVTDVSHVKQGGVASMTLLDLRDSTSRMYLCFNGEAKESTYQELPKISTREREVLKLLTKGLSSKQISDALSISQKTVDNHRQSLLRKTGSKSTAEVVAFAMDYGLM
ncbi:MAG TPA: LuxR C-terminal-related transcriptional regulator [Cyclobacteriaceae bacterium]|nr:LuxR C-terminal-related transcriptional regulator [Cyclobacteriaceae bacterium]HRJ80883.1 LuxR C-terminal-related transcriptional regulator [Cyclobacteriaceae bacterium]